MKFTREFFEDKVLIIRNQEQLNRVFEDLETIGEELSVKTFPMIAYQGRFKSIDISEIEESAVLQLKYDSDFSKTVIEIKE
jgi:hypothetical protein